MIVTDGRTVSTQQVTMSRAVRNSSSGSGSGGIRRSRKMGLKAIYGGLPREGAHGATANSTDRVVTDNQRKVGHWRRRGEEKT